MDLNPTIFYKIGSAKNKYKLLITKGFWMFFYVKFWKLFADTEISKNIT